MKTVKITPENKIFMVDVNFDNWESLAKQVGGYIETVRTQIMNDFFGEQIVMIVHEEGILKKLPVNAVGSYMYGTHEHGHPIVGNIVFGHWGYGGDITGPIDAEAMKRKLMAKFEFLEEGDADEKH